MVRNGSPIETRGALAWALGICLALTAGTGCNGGAEAVRSEAGITAVAQASPSPGAAGKVPARKGRKLVDTSSRREHQRQSKQQQQQ